MNNIQQNHYLRRYLHESKESYGTWCITSGWQEQEWKCCFTCPLLLLFWFHYLPYVCKPFLILHAPPSFLHPFIYLNQSFSELAACWCNFAPNFAIVYLSNSKLHFTQPCSWLPLLLQNAPQSFVFIPLHSLLCSFAFRLIVAIKVYACFTTESLCMYCLSIFLIMYSILIIDPLI